MRDPMFSNLFKKTYQYNVHSLFYISCIWSLIPKQIQPVFQLSFNSERWICHNVPPLCPNGKRSRVLLQLLLFVHTFELETFWRFQWMRMTKCTSTWLSLKVAMYETYNITYIAYALCIFISLTFANIEIRMFQIWTRVSNFIETLY